MNLKLCWFLSIYKDDIRKQLTIYTYSSNNFSCSVYQRATCENICLGVVFHAPLCSPGTSGCFVASLWAIFAHNICQEMRTEETESEHRGAERKPRSPVVCAISNTIWLKLLINPDRWSHITTIHVWAKTFKSIWLPLTSTAVTAQMWKRLASVQILMWVSKSLQHGSCLGTELQRRWTSSQQRWLHVIYVTGWTPGIRSGILDHNYKLAFKIQFKND